MMSVEEIDVIGLSKLSVPKCFGRLHEKYGPVAKSRMRAIERVLNSRRYKVYRGSLRKNRSRGKKIHLLGGDNWTSYEIEMLNKYSFIRSIDTSMPVWYGLHGKKIDIVSGKCNELLDKVDLFISRKISPGIEACIFHNLLMVYKFSKHYREVNTQ